MAQQSGGGFGWLVVGIAIGAAAIYFGPTTYQKYVQNRPPGSVRVEVGSDHAPGVWRRTARLDIEFSRLKANGQNWDWPMMEPELQLCIREGSEYRKCYGPKDPELQSCQGIFRCTTGPIRVPDVPFTVELNEWDDYNKPDPIGVVDCDVNQTCKFQLGVVTIRAIGVAPSPVNSR